MTYDRQDATKTAASHLGVGGWLWIQDNRNHLPKNTWVAATDDGMVASQPTIGELEACLRQKQMDPSAVCIAFIGAV